jgi:5-methylcytosine-specific restriction endonuclease McrA
MSAVIGSAGHCARTSRANNGRHNSKRRRRIKLLAYERDGGRCRYCFEPIPLEGAVGDHATPASRGGTSGLHNIYTACVACDRIKWMRTAAEFETLLTTKDPPPESNIELFAAWNRRRLWVDINPLKVAGCAR